MNKTVLVRASILAAGALALTAALPDAVDASEGASSRRRDHVTFTRTSTNTIGQAVVGPNGERIVPITATSSLTGDLEGSAFGMAALTAHTQWAVSAAAGVGVWHLTDSPCGSGTVIIWAAGFGSLGSEGRNEWRIAEGGGTGDLADVSGGGTFANRANGVTEYTGRVRCRR
jgi:hypothetical protein